MLKMKQGLKQGLKPVSIRPYDKTFEKFEVMVPYIPSKLSKRLSKKSLILKKHRRGEVYLEKHWDWGCGISQWNSLYCDIYNFFLS